jgi:hypothetical protein
MYLVRFEMKLLKRVTWEMSSGDCDELRRRRAPAEMKYM